MLILYILAGLALVGSVSSLVFLGLAITGAIRFRREARQALSSLPDDAHLPPVSLLKPLHGMEAQLKQNIESFFRQDYPHYEILFAADHAEDPALAVVREISARYPQIPCRILVTGPPIWPNPPVYSFHCMAEVAQYEILVTSDSDVEVSPGYLREVVPPLLDPKTGMVTCIYRGKNAGGFWSGIDAIGMSVEMTAGVLTANLFEEMRFGLGPTIALRKDALARMGGYGITGDYFSNDFILGKLIYEAGYRVVLSSHVIDHVVQPMTFRRSWRRQVRWAKGTRQSRPKGHLGTGLIFAVPYGILGLFAMGLLGHWAIGILLFLLALLNRCVESLAIGWGVVRDPNTRRKPWLYPIRDLMGFLVWCASYLNTRTVWRDSRYQLVGERIVLRQTSSRPSNVERS